MDVCVHSGSGFRRRYPGALWLRVIDHQHEHQTPIAQERVVHEAKVAFAEQSVGEHGRKATWCSKRARVKLTGCASQRHGGDEDECTHPSLTLELWAAAPTPDADSSDGVEEFLSFIGSACVDLQQWRETPLASATRWYVSKSDQTTTKEVWSSSESSVFEEREERMLPDAAYFRATLVGSSHVHKKKKKMNARPEARADVERSTSDPASASPEFQFSLPSQSVIQNRRFRTTRVGEIVHEGNTEQLRELLPVVLYGDITLSTAQSEFTTSNQQMRIRCCLNTSLQLLQLSCQYACYCATKLDESTRNIELKQTKLLQHKANLQDRRRKMELQRRNLSRELQVLNSSLDGMRMLLQQVDPECLARLTEE